MLVVFAISLIVMTAMAGLALDVAHLYGVKSQLQVAADAAALAGANQLTGSSPSAMIANATNAATTVGSLNAADADSSGKPIPISLHTGDIVCGIWNPTPPPGTFTASTTGALNAVEVIANRRGASADQPMVQNGLINVLSLLGATGLNQTGISATAIACRTKLGLAPIAVNEYWTGGGHTYPYSYMRATNVDLSTPTGAGATFPFLGGAANRNHGGGDNTNGFVCLDYRVNQYDGADGHWYSVTNGTGSCTDCTNGNVSGPGGAPNNGSINNQKNTFKDYINNGIPDGLVPPNAVHEAYNPNYGTGSDAQQQNAYKAIGTFTSQCPYATIPHFDTSGNLSGLNLAVGQKVLVMVYDGYTEKNGGLSVVTVVGYGIIQVDTIGAPTWTGHAIPHGISGQADAYLLQPSSANPSCSDLMQLLAQVQQNFPSAKLVDSNDADMHYGMTTH